MLKKPCNIIVTVLVVSLFTLQGVSGQEFKMKFGDIDKANLTMETYENDTSVSAMVIGDFGTITYMYDQNQGFRIVYKRHTRIKIFKKEGYQHADHMIRYYSHNNIRENVGRIKATTYNLEKGKIATTKLAKKAIFRESINQYWNSVKFTMPEIKEGSIIEFEYTVSSNRLYSLPIWYFQRSIPVKWSELYVEAPEYFLYKQLTTGYDPLQISTQKTGYGSITESSTSVGVRDGSSRETYTEKFKTNQYRMVGIDVPPFIEEPMLTTKDNYILKVKFELARTSYPNQPQKLYTETWESINLRLVEHSGFGEQLKIGQFLNKPLDAINLSTNDPIEKLVNIHRFIQNHMKWDGFNSKYSGSLRTAYNQQSGTVADINLMLVLMLKKAGFNASPVVLSTRSNGFVNKFFPMESSMNYVIAMVELDGKIYMMDGTDPYCTVNMLPRRCLNGEGLIVEKFTENWVNLNPLKGSDSKSLYKLDLNEEGDFTGSIEEISKDYAGYMVREEIGEEKSEDDYIETIEDENPGIEIVDYSISNLKDLYKPLIENYDVNISGVSDVAGDMIYLNPLFNKRMENNLFRIEDRKYPIDFGAPISEEFSLELKIPEGYRVEEIPENLELNLGGDRIVFSYEVKESDGVITLTNKLNINDILFQYNDYSELKGLFNKIVEKHSEMVVLKKVSSNS